MTDDAELVKRLRDAVSGEHLRGAPYTVVHNTPGALLLDAADRIESQAAEIERLRDGGCARDQTTTQFCAEAAKFAREVGHLHLALKIARQHGLKNHVLNGNAAVTITDWIDANDPGRPIPWIDGPFFAKWAADNGLSNVNGFIDTGEA